jgi:hypothetical protein
LKCGSPPCLSRSNKNHNASSAIALGEDRQTLNTSLADLQRSNYSIHHVGMVALGGFPESTREIDGRAVPSKIVSGWKRVFKDIQTQPESQFFDGSPTALSAGAVSDLRDFFHSSAIASQRAYRSAYFGSGSFFPNNQ